MTAIACGGQFNDALLTNGTIVSWGQDYFNQTNVPGGLTNVTAIAAGAEHTLALLSNGTVAAWGDNTGGDTNIRAGCATWWPLRQASPTTWPCYQTGRWWRGA